MRSSPLGVTLESTAARALGASAASSGQDASQALTSERRATGTTMPTVPVTEPAAVTLSQDNREMLQIVLQAENGKALVENLLPQKPDVIILDIEM